MSNNGNGHEPSTTDSNGRDGRGRFSAGNKLAKGNPYARRVARIRAALMRAADPAQIEKAARALMAQAVGGDRFALAEILDRIIGKPATSDVLERIEKLEAILLADGREVHRVEHE